VPLTSALRRRPGPTRRSGAAAQRRLLRQIPGVDDRIALAIIAEIGIDMTVFGNARRLTAWAGVCPGNHESAGKKKNAVSRKGNIHLKTTLVQAAVCAARTKGSYDKDKYHRLKASRGSQRAAMAIAHKILVGGVSYARQNRSLQGTRRGVP
jgi:transposase